MVDLNRRNSSPPRSEDLTNRVMMYCDKFFRYLRNLSNKPVPIQIGVGASSGFVLSYFFTKGSKICALLLGCSFILLQVGIAFFISMYVRLQLFPLFSSSITVVIFDLIVVSFAEMLTCFRTN